MVIGRELYDIACIIYVQQPVKTYIYIYIHTRREILLYESQPSRDNE